MSKLERVLKLGSMQEFLEMSDDDLKKAKTSGPLMAEMINRLWRAVCQLADERNLEAAEVDAMKREMEDWALEFGVRLKYADDEEPSD
ncbi:MAG: hypothetical protein V3S55_07640 [Nitrospiraceae bacterium]